ncbi:MAG: hypothetical protein A2Z72_07110 [Omnitrophica bacterium RBG_13_46_9]|nr:MAG: hypothetical protein A2Z72_07110 [Omnitrophica bacterium RBG_13_46_9]
MVYHLYNKSIADYTIFNNNVEFERIIQAIRYYQYLFEAKPSTSLSYLIKRKIDTGNPVMGPCDTGGCAAKRKRNKLIEIIAYCIMPTHLHLLVEELKKDGISIFLRNILNSYTRFFNMRHNRKGPLWEGRTKRVEVKSDEQLYRVTRYIHLNPVTAYLVEKPEEWRYSSYKEFISDIKDSDRICKYEHLLDVEPNYYKKYVNDRISYQRELAKIKHLLLETPPQLRRLDNGLDQAQVQPTRLGR